jgi:hypothetical protein
MPTCPHCGHEWGAKPKGAPFRDLTRKVKLLPIRAGWSSSVSAGRGTAIWDDGTESVAQGVWKNPNDKWAALFQGADRLRRMRASPVRGQMYQGDMPALKAIMTDDGEIFEVAR